MELAESKLIEALRTAPTAGSPRHGIKKTVAYEPVHQSKKSRLRCRCGICKTCQDSTRWERIFQEKFADPDYYERRLPHQGSSLNWL
jgi:hypothetical protein